MKKKICIVIANYYPEISKNLLIGVKNKLKKNKNFSFNVIYAPGVFEIPFIISKNIKKYDAFVSLGCVIKGQTPHFDFISKAAIEGIMHLSILHHKPIGNGILTCLNLTQALVRSNPKKKDKGGEAVKATLSLLKV